MLNNRISLFNNCSGEDWSPADEIWLDPYARMLDRMRYSSHFAFVPSHEGAHAQIVDATQCISSQGVRTKRNSLDGTHASMPTFMYCGPEIGALFEAASPGMRSSEALYSFRALMEQASGLITHSTEMEAHLRRFHRAVHLVGAASSNTQDCAYNQGTTVDGRIVIRSRPPRPKIAGDRFSVAFFAKTIRDDELASVIEPLRTLLHTNSRRLYLIGVGFNESRFYRALHGMENVVFYNAPLVRNYGEAERWAQHFLNVDIAVLSASHNPRDRLNRFLFPLASAGGVPLLLQNPKELPADSDAPEKATLLPLEPEALTELLDAALNGGLPDAIAPTSEQSLLKREATSIKELAEFFDQIAARA